MVPSLASSHRLKFPATYTGASAAIWMPNAAGSNTNTTSSASMRQPSTVAAGLAGAGCGRAPAGLVVLTALVPAGADSKIVPRNANTAATAAHSSRKSMVPATKEPFAGGAAGPDVTGAAG